MSITPFSLFISFANFDLWSVIELINIKHWTCSTLQTRFLDFYYLLRVHMLLPVKKWPQRCPVQRVLLTRGFNNASKQWWLRFVTYDWVHEFSLPVLWSRCWLLQYAWNLFNVFFYSLPFELWFLKFVKVERLLSAEQKATDYRSPDDGIAPDHRPTTACIRYKF